jgi:serine/threonine-protein kinase HipA
MTTRTLVVRMHGETVGTLSREKSGKVTFEMDQSWQARSDRPVLSVAFEGSSEKKARRLFVAGTGLPPYFENLLPEGDSRAMLSALNGVKPGDGFGLLERTGRSLFGAVEIFSLSPPAADIGVQEVGRNDSIVSADFSIAGVQQKLLLSRVGERMTAKSDTHILKIPDMVHSGLVRNEFAIMKLAARAGFEAAPVEMTTVRFPRDNPNFSDFPETMEVLAVERFDRLPDGGKVHAEEVHQMFGELVPVHKYSMSAEAVCSRLVDSGVPAQEVLKALAFHAITGNGDAHAKNFAVVYPDGRNARLSPLYDAVSTVVYGDTGMALPMGGSKSWKEVDMGAFERLGGKLGLPADKVRSIVSGVVDMTLGAWHEIGPEFPDHLREKIEAHFTSGLALTRDYIAANGFPAPLPRLPDHPQDTHKVARSAMASVVSRVSDGKVDNPQDAAIVRRGGQEFFVQDGLKVEAPSLARSSSPSIP